MPVVEHKTYGCFSAGEIANPNKPCSKIKSRVGKSSTATNGQKMQIIAYRRDNDIDVQFEDGTIVTHKTYGNFSAGRILNPNKPCSKIKSRVGESSTATNGQQMQIIAYRGCQDIDVQFEDGTIVEHKTYDRFKKGYIGYPKPNYS